MNVRPSTIAALVQAGIVILGFLIVRCMADGAHMPEENGLGYAVPGIVYFARDFGWVLLVVPLASSWASWRLEEKGDVVLPPLLGWGGVVLLVILFVYAAKRILIYP